MPLDVALTFELALPPTAAALYVRTTGSGAAYTVIPATQDLANPNAFALTIPADFFDPAGADFYIEYVDDGEILTSPELDPETNPIRLPVIARRIAAPTTFRPRQYEMVTVPVQFLSSPGVAGLFNQIVGPLVPGFVLPTASPELESVLGDEAGFGLYDEERWRVLRWDPLGGALENGAYQDGPLAVGAMEPGKAVWLVAANGGGFDVESVYPAGFDLSSIDALQALEPASGPVEVLLEPGWNQIGSPYLFPITWADVEGSALVNAPVASVDGEYEPQQDVLEPWRGYFVFNPTLNTVPLLFSIPDEQAAPQATLAARLLGRAGADAFLVQIQTDEVAPPGDVPPLRTRNTFAGIGRQALRLSAPPPVNGGLQVRLREADGRAFASAITDASAGATWTLDLRADPSWTRARTFEVRLDEHGRRPAGWSHRLTDAATGEPIALGSGAFRVTLGPGQATRAFHFTLAPDADQAALPTAPSTPLFGRVGPNPVQSGRAVELAYRTPGGAAEIVVLDLLGRTVHRFAASAQPGWHEATWTGRADGGALAPGLYLFHLRTPAGHAVSTLTVLR